MHSVPRGAPNFVIPAIMKALGYTAPHDGFCAGIAAMWLQAILVNQEEIFYKRIEYINNDIIKKVDLILKVTGPLSEKIQNNSDKLAKIHQQLLDLKLAKKNYETIQKKPIDESKRLEIEKLEKDVEYLNDDIKKTQDKRSKELVELKEKHLPLAHPIYRTIYAFFDGIELYQNSTGHTEIFGKKRSHREMEEITKITGSIKLEEKKGLTTIWSEDEKYYSNKELIETLELWRLALLSESEKIKDQKNIPRAGLMLTANEHKIAIHYDIKKRSWVMFDANQDPNQIINNNDIVPRTVSALLSKTPTLKLETEVITTKDSPMTSTLKETYDFLKKSIWERAKKAVISGNKVDLEEALKFGKINPDRKIDDAGNTLADLACLYKHDDLLPMLERYDADLSNIHQKSLEKLHKAILANDSKSLLSYAEKGESLTTQDKKTGQMCLHFAAQHGKDDIINTIVDLLMDLNFTDNEGNIPLHVAAKNCQYKTLEMLVTKFNSDINSQNKLKKTPAHLAIENNDLIMVKKLAELKADFTLNNDLNICPITLSIVNHRFDMLLHMLFSMDESKISQLAPKDKSMIDKFSSELIKEFYKFIKNLDPKEKPKYMDALVKRINLFGILINTPENSGKLLIPDDKQINTASPVITSQTNLLNIEVEDEARYESKKKL